MNVELPPEFVEVVAARVADLLADRFQPPEQWPQWMSITTASRYLDCSPARLYKLAERDRIPCVRDSRLWFERRSLDEWMAAKSNGRSTR